LYGFGGDMKYIQLECNVYLKKDIFFKDIFETLSKFISFSINSDDKFNYLHSNKKYKPYCFGGFLPMQKDKIYKKGDTYSFSLRTIDEKLASFLYENLRLNINNSSIQILEISKKVQKQFFISELYSATPVVVSSSRDQKGNPIYWTMQKDGDILKLQKQLQDNLEKKYKYFFGEEIQPIQNFIQLFEIKNKKPQTIQLTRDGKRVRLFGNKFKIVPNEDEVSQKLAFLSLAVGLGEKSSFGGGFCLGRGLK